jgi:hypothetical protein
VEAAGRESHEWERVGEVGGGEILQRPLEFRTDHRLTDAIPTRFLVADPASQDGGAILDGVRSFDGWMAKRPVNRTPRSQDVIPRRAAKTRMPISIIMLDLLVRLQHVLSLYEAELEAESRRREIEFHQFLVSAMLERIRNVGSSVLCRTQMWCSVSALRDRVRFFTSHVMNSFLRPLEFRCK